MIDYIVEVSVQEKKVQEWKKWMKTEHIPEVMKTGFFLQYSFSTMAYNGNEHLFQIRYRSYSLRKFRLYQQEFAKELQQKHTSLFGDVTRASRRIEIVTSLEV